MSEHAAQPDVIRVLLVEDNVDHAMLARRGFAEDTFEVTHVRTGADAVEEARRGSFDVCLLDQRLPDAEGVDVCRSLREEGVEGWIVLVTSTMRDALADAAFDAGADDYVVKGPSFMGRLVADVKAQLGA